MSEKESQKEYHTIMCVELLTQEEIRLGKPNGIVTIGEHGETFRILDIKAYEKRNRK